MWEGQLALAAQGWRVIAPQLRGFDGLTLLRHAAANDAEAALDVARLTAVGFPSGADDIADDEVGGQLAELRHRTPSVCAR